MVIRTGLLLEKEYKMAVFPHLLFTTYTANTLLKRCSRRHSQVLKLVAVSFKLFLIPTTPQLVVETEQDLKDMFNRAIVDYE